MWIGIDDTDSPRGGCTTHVFTEVVRTAQALGFDLLGDPRLVRLNPNVPWKTRGNAALSGRFGHGKGRPLSIGRGPGGEPIRRYTQGSELDPDERQTLLDEAWSTVVRTARVGEPGTEPALVATGEPLPASLYWRAVRGVVSVSLVQRILRRVHATARWIGEPRGVVGAAASIAWPAESATYELLAYRPADREGVPRKVSVESMRRAERAEPRLFLTYDARTRRLLAVPHTPCPILFGLRSRTRRPLLRARWIVRSEPVDRWLIYRTNQGTGDHLVDRPICRVPPLTSVRSTGLVSTPPQARPGGHVVFTVRDRHGHIRPVIAFEPTKTLPRVAQRLAPGDRVRLWGSRGTTDLLRLEGIEILAVAPRYGPARAPPCPVCGRRTQSAGRGRGYRCRRDGTRLPPEAAERVLVPPGIEVGVYHPTPSARRHLAPLEPTGPIGR